MKKYFRVLALSLSSELQYRLNIFSLFISEALVLSGFVYLWFTVYREGYALGAYALPTLITYYLVNTFFRLFIETEVGWQTSVEIQKGELSKTLVRPLSYLGMKFAEHVGWQVALLGGALPLFAIVVVLLRAHLVFPQTLATVPMIVLALFGALVLNFLVLYCVGLLAFFFEISTGFIFAFYIASNLLGGMYLPLDLFPASIRTLSSLLPFSSYIAFPINLYLERLGALEIARGFAVQMGWIFVFYLIARVLWTKGTKRYEGYGQ